jgi:hypothetical protein
LIDAHVEAPDDVWTDRRMRTDGSGSGREEYDVPGLG